MRPLVVIIVLTCSVPLICADQARDARREAIRGCFATYDNAPRTSDGRVDIQRLIEQLRELHCNTYDFLIRRGKMDWPDLKRFLPRAQEAGINVWVTICPPSEPPAPMPFGDDYVRWAQKFGHLAARHPNLTAWNIDDFTHNLRFFNPEYLRKMMDAAHAESPHLAFVPVAYFPRITTDFARDYDELLDGIQFYYRHESAGANLTDPSLCAEEIAKVREIMGPDMPIILGFYATAHSRLGSTTPEYVEEVMRCGHEHADGIHVYCHQKPGTPKYEIVKRLFRLWNP